MTVAVCYIVHNDLSMLRCTLPYEMRWADQIVVLDLGSTDGTKDFCARFLRPSDVYHRRDTNTIPEAGFSEARAFAARLAATDWVAHWGANFMLRWEDGPLVHQILGATTADVLSTETTQIVGVGDKPWTFEKVIGETAIRRTEHHRMFIRRNSGVEFKGYIHEEAYRGEVNAYGEAEAAPLRHYHFEASGNHKLRSKRNCWMFKRAMENPELQRYTNRWWYDTYYPANQERILAEAMAYEEYVAVTGDK